MFCAKCGTALEEGACFCGACGAPVEKDVFEKTVSAFDEAPIPVAVVKEEPVVAEPAVEPVAEEPTVVTEEPVKQEVDLDKTVSAFEEQPVPVYVAPVYTAPEQPMPENEVKNNGSVNFGEAIGLLFKNIVNFSGRASLSEFWWGYLFIALVSTAGYILPYIGWLISLATVLPSISLIVRRLNDTGKPWNYIFMGLIPFAGIVLLIIEMCKPTDAYR